MTCQMTCSAREEGRVLGKRLARCHAACAPLPAVLSAHLIVLHGRCVLAGTRGPPALLGGLCRRLATEAAHCMRWQGIGDTITRGQAFSERWQTPAPPKTACSACDAANGAGGGLCPLGDRHYAAAILPCQSDQSLDPQLSQSLPLFASSLPTSVPRFSERHFETEPLGRCTSRAAADMALARALLSLRAAWSPVSGLAARSFSETTAGVHGSSAAVACQAAWLGVCLPSGGSGGRRADEGRAALSSRPLFTPHTVRFWLASCYSPLLCPCTAAPLTASCRPS